ncbi:hypothetical protein EBB07_17745 [Paenibacillaceae bacterium]|nr:hypothetical protein EBB07_17745 [Paenibacillaceae bacterium]
MNSIKNVQKTIITSSFVLLLVLIATLALHAEPLLAAGKQSAAYAGLNDKRLQFPDAQPELLDNTFFVPARDFAEALQLRFNASKERIRISSNSGNAIDLYPQDNLAVKANGDSLPMWMFVRDGRLMVPAAYIARYFGYEVGENDKLPMIRVKNKDARLDDEQFFTREKKVIDQERKTADLLPIYLTFDDGPTANTMKLLDVLDKYDAKATLFMVGNRMADYPDALKRIVKDGHQAGLHSLTHVKDKFYHSPQTALKEMNDANSNLKKITGAESTIIRTPYGSKPYFTKSYRDATAKAGYHLWDWNVDSLDWKYKENKSKWVAQVVQDIKRLKGKGVVPVVLMHDQKATLGALPQILEALTKEGFTFKAIEQDRAPLNFWEDKR